MVAEGLLENGWEAEISDVGRYGSKDMLNCRRDMFKVCAYGYVCFIYLDPYCFCWVFFCICLMSLASKVMHKLMQN